MLLLSLLITPIIGIFIVSTISDESDNFKFGKSVGLITSVINLTVSLLIFMLFNFSSNQFQFVQEYHEISSFDFYLGVDGVSIFFVLLTTIIMPISLLSNWSSITENVKSYVIIVLLLETLLLGVFLVLDILMFYIFFESILPPLFLLIGIFGSNNRVRASFYLFLYTLLGSLFLLLSILTISSIMGTTDFDALFKTNFSIYIQIILYSGIFIAFAVKTPTIFLNSWLLKAHVESPLGGSIILAAIVLKLSLYGILRVILTLLPKAYTLLTPMVFVIGVITILYASLSTLRTIDVKELIAYSSVSHAAVYLLGVFSNSIQGIEGGIILGLAHGFVSSGLFICAGGVLYDRSSTRLITFYRGVTQLMPIFSILFFILCLGNAGTPLSLNFIGEFMSLYGTFERLPPLGVFASSSIVFSAAYTIYMFNRISFGGSISKLFTFNIPDVSKREFYMLSILVVFTVFFGIYPSPILDGLHYNVSCLGYLQELICFVPITLTLKRNSILGKRFISLGTQIPENTSDRDMARQIRQDPQGFQDTYVEPIIREAMEHHKDSAALMQKLITNPAFDKSETQEASSLLQTSISAHEAVVSEGAKLDMTNHATYLQSILERRCYAYRNRISDSENVSSEMATLAQDKNYPNGNNADFEHIETIARNDESRFEITKSIIDLYQVSASRMLAAKIKLRQVGVNNLPRDGSGITPAQDFEQIRNCSKAFNKLSSENTTVFSEGIHDQLSILFFVSSSSLELSVITRGISMLWIIYIQAPVGYFQFLYVRYVIIPLKKWFSK